jgi:hypothetical protein
LAAHLAQGKVTERCSGATGIEAGSQAADTVPASPAALSEWCRKAVPTAHLEKRDCKNAAYFWTNGNFKEI